MRATGFEPVRRRHIVVSRFLVLVRSNCVALLQNTLHILQIALTVNGLPPLTARASTRMSFYRDSNPDYRIQSPV